MDLQGKRIAVLAADLYQEMEIWYPLLRFREEGAETVAVGAEAGKTYSSKKGLRTVISLQFSALGKSGLSSGCH